MNYLITTASSIQLTNAEGTTKTISKNQLWYRINKETITFLVLADAQPEGDGTCFFTSRISDLNVNGEVYDKDTIIKALDDIFEPVDIADVYTKRQIDEMLEEYAQVDDLNDFIMVDELPDYLADYQKKLVSGTNIKTVNGQSLLGEGNIVIEGGGGGSIITIDSALSSTSENPVQNKVVKGALDAKADKSEIPDMAGYPTTNQMNTAINSAVAGKADANSVPTKTSQLTNDSGFLTSHQSLDGLFNSVEYDSSAKRINFKDKTKTVVGYVDASDFVKDGMVEDVRIENGRLVIDFNTDSGITDISIPLTDIFNADNYYTKSEVDTALAAKANSSSLSTVATSGSYNDLSDKPAIPTQVNSDWNASSGVAQILNKPTLATVATSGSYNDLSDKPTIDSALSDQSTNAVQNAVVTGVIQQAISKTTKGFEEQARYFSAPLQQGQNLVAGTNITLTPTSTTMTGQLWDEETQQWVNRTYNVTGLEISASGGGSAQVQSDWNQTDTTAVDFIKNKPTIPTAITVDTEITEDSQNPVTSAAIYQMVGNVEEALRQINGTTNA